jgi:pimeloyl-ACP methyl ester carboxylesterase
MGGAIALSLAAKHPELPGAIVMLDGSLVRPEAMQALMQSTTPVLESPQYQEPLRQLLANALFLPSDDAARRERIIDGMCATPQHVMVSEWRSLIAHDTVADAKACAVPALYVGAANPAADMARLRELMPHVVLAQTAASGHFHQLEVPDQVNAMLERFLHVLEER